MQIIDLEKLGQRIKSKRLEMKVSQQQFADLLSGHQSAVSAMEKGERLPTTDQLLLLIQNCRMSADWWLFGKEDGGGSQVNEPQEQYTVSMPVRAMAGAGSPCCIDQMEPIGHINVDPAYNGPNVQVIEIRGTSMEPTIVDGAHVGVDITDREIISGQMYAVYIPHEGIVVKRIWLGPELVKIKSDNPQAPDHDMSIDRINWDTFVQGKVKWVIQKY